MKMWKSYERLRNVAIEVCDQGEAYGSIDRVVLAKLRDAAYEEEKVPVREEKASREIPDVDTPEWNALLDRFTRAYKESAKAFQELLDRKGLD